jgi:DNA-binding IclR family transcriptional regulator
VEPTRILRIFKLMNYLADSREGRSLSEISRELDLPLSSTHDLLHTMAAARIITNEDRRYRLGPVALSLAMRLTEAIDIRRIARPHLTELVERIEDDVYLAVRVNGSVMYVDRYPGKRQVQVTIRLGQPLYLHSTAVGKLYAALNPELEAWTLERKLPRLTEYTITDPEELARTFSQIRSKRVSISHQESFEGILGIAVPVTDSDGHMHAAIHVSLLLTRALDDRLAQLVAELQHAARGIGQELHGASADALPSDPV